MYVIEWSVYKHMYNFSHHYNLQEVWPSNRVSSEKGSSLYVLKMIWIGELVHNQWLTGVIRKRKRKSLSRTPLAACH